MTHIDAIVNEKIEALRRQYADQLALRAVEIESLWKAVEESGGETGSLTDFRQIAHRLAGSGATFGYPGVSESAGALELYANTILERGSAPTGDEIKLVRELLSDLRAASSAPGSAPDGRRRARMIGDEKFRRDKTIAIVDDDDGQAQTIAAAVQEAGFSAIRFPSPLHLLESVEENPVAAVIMDIVFPEGQTLGIEAVRELRNLHPGDVPILFLSAKSGFDTRLSAVQAGGDGFLAKPVNPPALIERLDRLVAGKPLGRYRILVLEKAGILGARCPPILEDAGMVTGLANSPGAVIEILEELHPDLALMDFELENLTGLDLAAVIRQHEDFADLPVFFLSPDESTSHRLLRMGLDEGDFLTKPVNSQALVTAVSERVERHRDASNFAGHDNLANILFGNRNPESADNGSTDNAAAVEDVPRPKILIADDDPHLLSAMSIQFESCGATVVTASNGEEAFSEAYFKGADLIVTDYMMPNYSGDYLLVRLKGAEQTKNIPVIVLTGRSNGLRKDFPLERELLGRRGAAAFLTKPMNFDHLLEVARRYVRFSIPGLAS